MKSCTKLYIHIWLGTVASKFATKSAMLPMMQVSCYMVLSILHGVLPVQQVHPAQVDPHQHDVGLEGICELGCVD